MNKSKLLMDADNAISESYKTIGKQISSVRELCGMKAFDFNEKLAEGLGETEDAVRCYPSRGISRKVDSKKLLSALADILESTVSKEELTGKNAVSYFLPLYCIAVTFEILEFFEWARDILTDDVRMRLKVEQFARGLWPESGEGLSAEDIIYLRECQNRYRTQRPNKKRILAAADKMRGNYSEIFTDGKPFMDVICDRATKRFSDSVFEIV